MSLIDYGNILTLLIEMFQMKEVLFETRGFWKEINSYLKRWNFTLNKKYGFQPIS